jgi:cysteine sulfinate desulfinase/cysteine desulfurase-like protein
LQTGLPEGVEAVFNCGSDAQGLPQTLSVGFRGAPGLTSGYIMRECMERGVIVAAGSACDANKKEVDYSPILKEFGVGAEVGVSTLRVSCGFWNKEAEGELVGRTVAEVVVQYIVDCKKK